MRGGTASSTGVPTADMALTKSGWRELAKHTSPFIPDQVPVNVFT